MLWSSWMWWSCSVFNPAVSSRTGWCSAAAATRHGYSRLLKLESPWSDQLMESKHQQQAQVPLQAWQRPPSGIYQQLEKQFPNKPLFSSCLCRVPGRADGGIPRVKINAGWLPSCCGLYSKSQSNGPTPTGVAGGRFITAHRNTDVCAALKMFKTNKRLSSDRCMSRLLETHQIKKSTIVWS